MLLHPQPHAPLTPTPSLSRSECYSIPTLSLFDAKGMAGNIIHAIATTNAIISGLLVLEALKVLAGPGGWE